MNYYIKKARVIGPFLCLKILEDFLIERSIIWKVAIAFCLLAPVVTQFGGYML